MKKLKSVFNHAVLIILNISFSMAYAALPSTSEPSNKAADGDYIGLIKGYAYDIAIVAGLIICCYAFYVVAGNLISVYSEIGKGRKTWGDIGVHGGVGIVLLVLIIYLVTEASGVIF